MASLPPPLPSAKAKNIKFTSYVTGSSSKLAQDAAARIERLQQKGYRQGAADHAHHVNDGNEHSFLRQISTGSGEGKIEDQISVRSHIIKQHFDDWGNVSSDPAEMEKKVKELEEQSAMIGLNPADIGQQSKLLFAAIRYSNLSSLRNILLHYKYIVNQKLYGFEGADTYGLLHTASNRCYTYTGEEKDGFFYPLHVAAEAGVKAVVDFLLVSGADASNEDYRGKQPEEKANGEAILAFYENRGLKYEEMERYDGQFDRNGERSGQGMLFLKTEGFQKTERLVYSGSFKGGLIHGYGVSYWRDSDRHRYAGRFRAGLMHGRGVEFDIKGDRIYQGTFRQGKREGRGEEFMDGKRVYKGQFADNLRHGFGFSDFGEGGVYLGRFEHGVMSGIGIYAQPTGDRYEGLFQANKPEGEGTYYKVQREGAQGEARDAASLEDLHFTATHAVWQFGKPTKMLPGMDFTPKLSDLPDIRSYNDVVSRIVGMGHSGTHDRVDPDFLINPVEEMRQMTAVDHSIGGLWKHMLMGYVKLGPKEAALLGIHAAHGPIAPGDELTDDAVEDMDDEVLGYHFLSSTRLFVAYVYVVSSMKVFEGRMAKSDMSEIAPDFEAVYHMVIDAVDVYNAEWEAVAQSSPESDVRQSAAVSSVNVARKVFMTDREKKEEELLKSRAEDERRGAALRVDPQTEYYIGLRVASNLEVELARMLTDDLQLQGDDEPAAVNEFAAELLYLLKQTSDVAGSYVFTYD